MDLQNLSQSPSQAPPPPPPPPPPPDQPPLKKPKMSTTTSDDDTTTTKPRRYKRRKVAIFFAYCGVGYQGMQKNPGAKTIEGDLEEALYFSGAVPEADRGQPKRFDWARSARTDKGVSAVGQVVSGRFYVDPPGFIERLNTNLNNQIRVFGFKRVTQTFNAKKFCDRRRYVYLLPVFALDATCHRDRESVMASLGCGGDELVRCVECSERGRKVLGVMGNRRGGGGGGANVEGNVVRNDNVNGNGDGNGDGDGELGVLSKIGVASLNSEKEECNVDSGVSSKNGDASLNNEKEECSVELGVLSKNGDGSLISEREECNVGKKPLKDGDDASMVESETLVEDKGVLLGNDRQEVGLGDVVGCGENGEGNVEEEDVKVKAKRSEFKYGEEEKKRFNRILKYYEGTHNFHNFTTRTKAEDPSAKRYIVSFEANTTLTLEGIEFVKCEVIGQSFMLHQIRKMIGMAVAVMRNFVPESIFERAFDQEFHINVPTAPEVGLYLDECFFTSYNNKWKDSHEEISMKDYAEEAEEFKLKYIYSHIAKTEHKEGSVAVWLHSLNHRNYPDFRPPTDDEVERVADVEVERSADGEVERVGIKVEKVAEDGLEKNTDDGMERVTDDQVKRAAGEEGEGVVMDVLP